MVIEWKKLDHTFRELSNGGGLSSHNSLNTYTALSIFLYLNYYLPVRNSFLRSSGNLAFRECNVSTKGLLRVQDSMVKFFLFNHTSGQYLHFGALFLELWYKN